MGVLQNSAIYLVMQLLEQKNKGILNNLNSIGFKKISK